MLIQTSDFRITAKHKNGSNNWVEWLLADAVMQVFASMGIGNVVIQATAPTNTDVIWYRPNAADSTQTPGEALVHDGTTWVAATSNPALAGWRLAGGAGGVIPNNSVGNAQLADMAAGRVKGRVGGSAGDPQDLSFAQVTDNLVPNNLVALLDAHFGNTVWRTHGVYDLNAGLDGIGTVSASTMTVVDRGVANQILVRTNAGQIRWHPVTGGGGAGGA